jgi:hypothetical protein
MDGTTKYVDQVFDSRIGRAEVSGTDVDRDYPTFFVDRLDNVSAMQVLWVNVPFSFWVIDEINNKIQMKFIDPESIPGGADSVLAAGVSGVYKDILLMPGTYTPAAFQQEFRRAIANAGFFKTEFAAASIASIFCLFDSSNSRMFIYSTLGQDQRFHMKFPNTEIAEMLGFRYNYEYQAGYGQVWSQGAPVRASGVRYLVSERTVKLSGVPRLNLHGSLSSDISKVGGLTRVNDQSGSDRLLTFPITGQFGSYLYYQIPSQPIPVSSESINRVSFYLTQGDRKQYSKRRTSDYSDGIGWHDMSLFTTYDIVNYLPLNGEGFQVCVRFFLND